MIVAYPYELRAHLNIGKMSKAMCRDQQILRQRKLKTWY